jgi:tetratricopeptide (TPR) repeat protein
MHRLYLFFSWLLILFFTIPVFSQQEAIRKLKENADAIRNQQNEARDQKLYRVAQSYMNTSRYELAIPILEGLCRDNPSNRGYYQTLLRAYLTVSRIEAADSLNRSIKKNFPGDLAFDIDYGNILYRKGERQKALDLWQQIIRQDPTQLNLYTQIADAMVQNRLLDEAVNIYLQGTHNIPRSEFLYQNIAGLYQGRLMYVEAAKYYLKYLDTNPNQQQFIFNRILSFQLEPEQQGSLLKTIESLAKESKNKDDILLLTAQLYQRYGKYEDAYKIYENLDKEQKQGIFLLQFARSAERDSSYHIALKAYTEVIRHYPDNKTILQAYQGSVTTLFSLARVENNSKFAEKAINLIDSVQTRYSDNPDIADMVYLKGAYYLDYYFDVDRAISIFADLIKNPRTPARQRNITLLKMGESYIIKGQLDEALNTFNKVTMKPYEAFAKLRTAQIFYYQKNWKKAGEMVNTILQKEGMASDITNDALALQLKLNQAQKSPTVLGFLADADLLLVQQKKGDAVKKLAEIVQLNSVPGALKSEAYRLLITSADELGKEVEALEYSQNAIQDSSMVQYADEYLFLMAGILEKQNDRAAEAFKIYQKLLENYPNSLFTFRARDRMKYLKENKLQELP